MSDRTKATTHPSNAHAGADKEFAGWRTSSHSCFEIHAGPFWYREEPDGTMRCAFRVEKKHLNDSGNVHGGCLMTFADFCLAVIPLPVLQGDVPTTINFNGNFTDAVGGGDLMVGTGEITRAGRSLIFVRGQLTVGGRTVFTFSGTIKRGQKKAA